GDQAGVRAARLDHSRPADQERRAQGLFKNPALVEPAMLAQIEALVGRINDDRVLSEPSLIEEVEQATDALVDGLDTTQVVVQVALIFPANEFFALEIGGTECGVSRLV